MARNLSKENRQVNKKAINELIKRLETLRDVHIPQAMREIGPSLIDHSLSTKEYRNQTGFLRRHHFTEVIKAGKSKQVDFFGKENSPEHEIYKANNNEVWLLLGARPFYAIFVEVKNGFSVVINTFLHFRREGKRLLEGRLRTFKLFG